MNKLKIALLVVMAAAVTACGESKKPVNMKYRELGKTGLMVSEIGIGCECFAYLDSATSLEYMSVALDSGVNYIDIYDSNPKVRSNIGHAIEGRREKIYIQGHVGVMWQNGQYKRTRDLDEMKEGFNDLLNRLHTNYVDVGMIHITDSFEDWQEVIDGPLMPYMQELKKSGKIKHIGLSSHSPAVALKAVESGLIEVLMFSINPAFDLLPAEGSLWNPKSYEGTFSNINETRAKLYETCQRMGVGISVMKVFGGGRLLDEKQSPLGKALTPCQCIQYALDRPAVGTALSGARTIDELLQSLHFETASADERNYTKAFAEITKANWQGECIYCGHCAPCPNGIDVAKITKLLNIAKIHDTIPQSIIDEYKALPHKAGECTDCGACESRCPFAVSVRKNMHEAKELFGE